MTRLFALSLIFAFAAWPASAQQLDWKAECDADAAKGCVARTSIGYRLGVMLVVAPKTLTVSVRDDPAKPLVSMRLADTEVRYAQVRLDQPTRSSDMVCDGVDCAMSFADARATIDGMKAGRRAAIFLFTNNGQVVQVGLGSDGFAEAVARTRPN